MPSLCFSDLLAYIAPSRQSLLFYHQVVDVSPVFYIEFEEDKIAILFDLRPWLHLSNEHLLMQKPYTRQAQPASKALRSVSLRQLIVAEHADQLDWYDSYIAHSGY